jgi:hypothetical protein
VKRHYSGQAGDGIEQRGHIGEADQRLGPAGHGTVVNLIQQPERAIAAANAPNGIDGRVLEGSVEVGNALVVGAGEVARAAIGILA